jgi:flavin reductase (DIM6/NTAB) family NADH-FMN oxidoreductase RutF
MKVSLKGRNLLYPMPVTLIGAVVGGRPNFINIAHVGILNAARPHLISLGMGKAHHTNLGIRENREFSVNLLSRDQVAAVDHVGLVSGAEVDKSAIFDIEYRSLAHAPLIVRSPLAMECRLVDIYDTAHHDVFIGEVVESWAEEAVLSGGKPDLAKVQPILFDMAGPSYWSIGGRIGQCWSIGRQYGKDKA